jgi:membrane-associated phospholipid phosphatase
MLLSSRFRPAATVLSPSFVLFFCFLATSSAQTVPPPISAKPMISVSRFQPRDGCILLTRALCDGLPPQTADPAPPTRQNGGVFHRAISRIGRDQAGLYASPFHKSNLKWDAAFLIGTAALIATDRQTSGEISHNNVDISRNISDAAIYGTGAAAGAILVTGWVTHDRHARETGYLTTEALVNALPIYVGMQLIAGRERPDDGVGHGRFWQEHNFNTSFPGGHAMFAWTMASVIAHEYPRPWVKVLVYGAAATVSVARFTGREHFASDIAVGSVLGYLIGRHVFHAHCSAEFSEACR